MPNGSTGFSSAPEVRALLGGNVDSWRLLVIADRYQEDEAGTFFAYAERLANHMKKQAPFDQPPVKGQFQVYACFTPTDSEGMFECRSEGVRRYYGKPQLVRDYLARHKDRRPVLDRRRNDLVLVLMNFRDRGGAGEQGNDNIAWSTPVHLLTEDNRLQEDWCDVTLHELGHAFDLDDEYDEPPWPEGEDMPLRETNVWRDDRGGEAPWAHLCEPAPPDMLESGRAGQLRDDERAAFAKIGVGMFQGARYRKDRFWRSAFTCKMRNTPDPFCQVCQNQIVAKMTGN